jgi:hypothetical protein
MKKYEMVREIFNQCKNNQMRDVFFEEVETDQVDNIVAKLCEEDKNMTCERRTLEDGSIVFYLNSPKFHQKISFTEI